MNPPTTRVRLLGGPHANEVKNEWLGKRLVIIVTHPDTGMICQGEYVPYRDADGTIVTDHNGDKLYLWNYHKPFTLRNIMFRITSCKMTHDADSEEGVYLENDHDEFEVKARNGLHRIKFPTRYPLEVGSNVTIRILKGDVQI